MLVELELVSMTVGLQQHVNLFAVVGVLLGPCSMVVDIGCWVQPKLVSNWLHSIFFSTLTPFGW
jgi:hypothetical protein